MVAKLDALDYHAEIGSITVQKARRIEPELRQLIKNKIRELEFKVALEPFSAVARLVLKDDDAKNPKAKAALDKDWENLSLRTKGVWDESRVRECKSIVEEARKNGQTIHLGRIFEACYEKGSELPPDDPRRKFKGRTVLQGNNVCDQDSDHALFPELGSSRASMEAAKLLDAFGPQPGFSKAQDAIEAYIQALFTRVPTWLSIPRNRWQRILAADGSFGVSIVRTSGQWRDLGKSSELQNQ